MDLLWICYAWVLPLGVRYETALGAMDRCRVWHAYSMGMPELRHYMSHGPGVSTFPQNACDGFVTNMRDVLDGSAMDLRWIRDGSAMDLRQICDGSATDLRWIRDGSCT